MSAGTAKMPADVLSAIVAAAKASADARERLSASEVERIAAERRPNGAAFESSLRADGIRVIAECKRRSPSRGILRAIYEPAVIARGYAKAGAAAISVLTEPAFFDGSLDHLREVRAAVKIPLLRKDFVVTDFQVVEARAAGADAVLLIVAALKDANLRDLMARAGELGLAALVEVHNREELERALSAGATIVGVNSRNLKTLEVGTTTFDELAPHLPASVTAVAESGLKSAADLMRLRRLGYRAFLIGERFMTEADPGAGLRTLLDKTTAVPE